MPSSAIRNDGTLFNEGDNDLAFVMSCYDRAAKFGLNAEWLEWYTCGVKQGLPPREAAVEALLEWDAL